MSLNTLSNLAVQDITDESAAVHSGGVVTFTGFNDFGAGPLGDSGAQALLGNNPTVGASRTIAFTNAGFPMGAMFNNTLDAFRISGVTGTQQYRVTFFDDLAATQVLGVFNYVSNNSGNKQFLAAGLQNRTSAIRVQRIA